MYQLDFDKVKENDKLKRYFKYFFSKIITEENQKISNVSVDLGEREAYFSMHSMNEIEKNKTNNGVISIDELLNVDRGFKNYSFVFSKNLNSKYTTSKIYGLKNKFEICPNILLDKEEFKSKYISSKMPDYNYDLRISSSKIKELGNYLEINDSYFNSKSDGILNFITKEILEIFSKYGEIELVNESKKGFRKVYSIKNIINFHVVFDIEKSYKILTNNNKEYSVVPNYKLNVKLREGLPIFQEIKYGIQGKTRMVMQEKMSKEHYFKVELRYLDFVKNKNFFVFCMTPHGYIRIKKEYSKEFFTKITYHYLFKRYFEKYGVNLSHEDLENNPESFFNLISLLKY